MKASLKRASFVRALVSLVLLATATGARAQNSFNHQIPFKLPKGTNGMQPDIGLVYDSGGGNGIAGVGWQLAGLSAITRVNYGNGIHYAGGDTYAHSRLGVLMPQGDGSYRSKRESFTRLVPSGTCGDGPCSWVAYDRSGARFYYGTTHDSSVVKQGSASVVTWNLAKVADLFGNSYEVAYASDAANGEAYPSVITYTKGPGLTSFRTVEFAYEARPDVESGYYQGTLRATTQRLKWIEVKSEGALLHKYRLDYGQSAATGRSLLTAVQEYGSDGASTMPAQSFEWQEGGTGLTQQNWHVSSHFEDKAFTFTGDFNGDGMMDVASRAGQDIYVYLSYGSGFAESAPWRGPGGWGDAAHTWVGDFNGDGKTDIATAIGGTIHVGLSNGSGFDQQVWPVPDNWGDPGYRWTGDFNGDGRTDIAAAKGGDIYVDLSTGSGFDQQVWQVEDEWGHPELTWTGDLNGDGKTDIASICRWQQPPSDPTARWNIVCANLSTGSGFDRQEWIVRSQGDFTIEFSPKEFDFNGDGKTDVAAHYEYDGFVVLSTGTGFEPQPHFPLPVRDVRSEDYEGDFNGDGTSDIALVKWDSSDLVYLSLFTSSGVITVPPSKLLQGLDGHYWSRGVADFNGDGKMDIASIVDGDLWVALANSPSPDLMTTVHNGLGGTVTVSYAPAAQVPGAIVPTSSGPGIPNTAPRQLVTKVTTIDGRGGSFSTRYGYSDGRFLPGKIPDQRDLGFAYVDAVDEQTGQWTRTYYRQDPPFEGHVAHVDAFASTGQLVSRTVHSYDIVNPSAGTELVRETQEAVTAYELGTPAFTQTTTSTYDEYGNPAVKSQDADGLPNVTITTAYANDASRWILGRIVEMKTTSGSVTLGWMRNTWTGDVITAKSEWLDSDNSWITTAMAHDANGNVTSVTEPSTGDGFARTTTTEYDATFHAYPVSVTNALGHVTRRTHNADGLVTSSTDANGQVTSTAYDLFGRKVKETRPDGGTTTYSYMGYGDPSGQHNLAVTAVDESRTVWKAEYFDGSGFVYRVTSSGDCPEHAVIEHRKDGAGRPYQTSEPYCQGGTPVFTTSSYDAAGRVSAVTAPDGKTARRAYGPTTQSATDPNGQTTVKTFDARKRVTAITDAAGQTTSYGYDPLGRLVSATLPDKAVSTVAYDSLNRKTSVTDPQLGTTASSYDALGNLTKVTTGGKTVTYTHDALNRAVRKVPVNTPGPGAIVYDDELESGFHDWSWAAHDLRATSPVHSGARSIRFLPVGWSGLTFHSHEYRVSNFDGIELWVHGGKQGGQSLMLRVFDGMKLLGQRELADALGGPIQAGIWQRVWGTFESLGISSGKFDAIGLQGWSGGFQPELYVDDIRLVGTGKEPPVTYTYDEADVANGKGRLTTQMDAGGTTRLAYAATGQLKSFVKEIDEESYSQSFTYDLAGRLTQLTYPNGSYADYTYTGGGNLATVSLDGTALATWSGYNASGKPGGVAYGNSVGTAYQYDVVNHLTSLKTAKGAATLQDLTYDWYSLPNTGGLNIGSITDNRANKVVDGSDTDETQTYTYDSLYRLTQAVGAWGTKSYGYDAIGNVTAFGGVTDRALTYAGQQVTSGTGLAGVTYDATGGMQHKVQDGVTWDYEWTAEGRLATVKKNGAQTARVVYDGDGQRVKKVFTPKNGPDVTTTYIGKMYEKRAHGCGPHGNANDRHTLYVFGNGQLVATVTREGRIATAFNDANRWRTELAAGSMYDGRSALGLARKAHHLLNAAAMHPQALRWWVMGSFALFAAGVLAALSASVLGKTRRPRRRRRGFSPVLRLASLGIVMVFGFSACSGGGGVGGGGSGLYRAQSYLISGDTTKGPAIGTYFYHRNHINSSSVITDVDGKEVTRIVYLPFGEISQKNSSGKDTVTSKFTGQEYDEETGLYYYGARYYDPSLGRFVSADSIVPDLKDAQAFNRYSYVKNNPIVYTDPTGHFFDWIADAASAVWDGVKAIGNAVAAAGAWLANAAASVARFVGHAAGYAWEQLKAMATNPAAIATFVIAVALSIATLNPGPVSVWAQSTALAVAAVSLALAAGVRNPIVLAVIGAAAGAAAGGAGSLKDVLRILVTAGAAAAIQELGVSDVAAWIGPVSAVANYMLQNRLGNNAEQVASAEEVVEPGETSSAADQVGNPAEAGDSIQLASDHGPGWAQTPHSIVVGVPDPSSPLPFTWLMFKTGVGQLFTYLGTYVGAVARLIYMDSYQGFLNLVQTGVLRPFPGGYPTPPPLPSTTPGYL